MAYYNPDQDFQNASEELKALETALNNQSNMQKAAEADLLKLKSSNVRAVIALEVAERNKVQAARIQAETEILQKRKANLDAEIKLEISKINQVKNAALAAENELTSKRQAAIDASTALMVAQQNRLKGLQEDVETTIAKSRLKHEEEIRKARIDTLTYVQQKEESIKTKVDVIAIKKGYYAEGDAAKLKQQATENAAKNTATQTQQEWEAAAQKKGKPLTTAEKKAIYQRVKAENDARLKLELGDIDKKEQKSAKVRAKYTKLEKIQENKDAGKKIASSILSSDTSLGAKLDALASGVHTYTYKDKKTGKEKEGKDISEAFAALASISQQLGKKADEIAVKKGAVDTRLQGSNNNKWVGSY